MNSINNYQVCGFVMVAGCVFKIKSVQKSNTVRLVPYLLSNPCSKLATRPCNALGNYWTYLPLHSECIRPTCQNLPWISQGSFRNLRLIYQVAWFSTEKRLSPRPSCLRVVSYLSQKSTCRTFAKDWSKPQQRSSSMENVMLFKMVCWILLTNPKANHEALKLWTMRKAGNLASMSHNWKYMSKSNPTVCKRWNGAMPCWKTWNLLFESLIKGEFPGTVKRWFLNVAPANAPVSVRPKGRWHGTIWHVCS